MAVIAVRTHNVKLEPSPFGRDYHFAICPCGWVWEVNSDLDFEDARRLHAKFADSAVIVLEPAC